MQTNYKRQRGYLSAEQEKELDEYLQTHPQGTSINSGLSRLRFRVFKIKALSACNSCSIASA